MQKAVIVVPIYKETLTNNENIALMQLYKVLGKYPICIVAPEKLKNYVTSKYKYAEFFLDKYFTGTSSYNDLLLSDCFYKRFLDYEYMLIYQIDAFVFSDRLMEFCDRGYDYIGSPWPNYGRKSPGWNGGFSLRNIKSCLRVLKYKNLVEEKAAWLGELVFHEDQYFSVCGAIKELNFKVPTSRSESLEFGMQHNLSHVYEKKVMQGKLPFGTHAWYRRNAAFWKPIIEKYGYVVTYNSDDDRLVPDKQIQCNAIKGYLNARFFRENNTEKTKYFSRALGKDKTYSLWGFGDDGKELYELMGVSLIRHIYDKKIANEYENVEPPSIGKIRERNDCIIISTRKYENEVAAELENIGLKKGTEFISYNDVMDKAIREYFKAVFKIK